MSLKFFHLERLEKHISELAALRYRDLMCIDEMVATRDLVKSVNPLPMEPDKSSFVMKKGEFWSGRDEYIWLNKEISIPAEWSEKDVVGVFDFGTTDIGNNSGFESLCYLNGQPYQGVDSNHKEVFIDSKKSGEVIRFDFRLWSGLEGGGEPKPKYHQFLEGFMAWLDPFVDDLYYTGFNIIETMKVLDDNNYYKHELEKLMIKTVQMIDFTNKRSDEFYESVRLADEFLNENLEKMQKDSKVNVYGVGHTHIDVAWLWRLKHTREKAARSFSTVNRLMERFDEYVFLQTQAQLYEYVMKDFPDIYENIKKRVAEGKWEPSGSMWVEADCNITSGESLVRQILYGKKFFMKEFGYDNSFLWLPDVFGYSWAMPQILKKSGIDTFITTKISWNEMNRMPYDTFVWRGIDGSEVLTHFITTPDVCGDTKFYTYNGNILPKIVEGIWENYGNKDLNSDLLLSYGYGDGGGGVNRDMLENRRRISKIPGLPCLETSNVTDYLKQLHKTIKDENNNGYLHVWDNELYLEFHRGTYTSQAYNKKMNRYLELKYKQAELLQVMVSLNQKGFSNYLQEDFEAGWKIILRNQFHDIIPGSSIHEVYEDSKIEYQEASEIADRIINKSLEQLKEKASDAQGMIALNALNWVRDTLVEVEGLDLKDKHFEDEAGNVLVTQLENEKAYVGVKAMKPLSLTQLLLKEGKVVQDNIFTVETNKVESNQYIIKWNEQGHLVKIYDKKAKRNVLKGLGNVLEIFEDKPRMYDAWEMEPTIDLKKEVVKDFKGAKVMANGPQFVKIQFIWQYNKSTITQNMKLYNYSGRIDFETTVDWQERDKLMKVAFPVDVRSIKARYDIQYGNVERPTHRSTSWDFAKFEVVGHQWADLSERGFGVSLLNNCKYGYDIKDNVMRLSLLKSASFPDPTADLGIQEFTYALYVHEEEWYKSALIQEAWDLNTPVLTTSGILKSEQMPFEIEGENIVVDAVKKAEDEDMIIFRLHETSGGKSELNLKLNFNFKDWCEADLMEKPADVWRSENEIKHTLCGYELYTIMIRL